MNWSIVANVILVILLILVVVLAVLYCGRIGEVPDCGGIACEYLHIASRCTVFDLSDSLGKEELSQNG